MANIYKLLMLSDEDDAFLREYEIPDDITLFDLHQFIGGDLGYDDNGVVSFFMSDTRWNRLAEYTLFDMGEGGPAPMPDIKLTPILEMPQARLIYLFDIFNDRALYLESLGKIHTVAGTQYPRTSVARGQSPGQYQPRQSGTGNSSIFDEAMDDFGSFEGDEYYDDEF